MADRRSDELVSPLEVVTHPDPVNDRADSGPEGAGDLQLVVTRPGLSRYGAAAAVTALAAVVYGWQVQRPGAWMDETATVAACRRSLGELVRLVGNVDLVHFGYYLLARTVWQLDPSLTAIRLISVVAMSLTCGLLVLIGHRLGSLRIGVVAGLLMALSPHASRFAQEARSVALVALVATLLTWYLIGMLLAPSGGRQRDGQPWFPAAVYALGLILLTVTNLLALVILVPHALIVRLLGRAWVQLAWFVGAAVGVVLLVPFVLADFGQRGQVSWLQKPQPYIVKDLVVQQFGGMFGGAVLVLLVLLVLLAVGGRRAPEGPVRAAVIVGAAWAVLPPVLLLAVSMVHPIYDIRYVFYCVPGTYLLVAALAAHVRVDAARLPHRWAPAVGYLVPALVLALFAIVGLGMQRDIRGPLGHSEDTARVAAYLADHARPGDVFLMVPTELRIIEEAYPEEFAALDDIELVTSPVVAGTLDGRVIGPGEVGRVLLPHPRVWLITGYYQPEALYSDTEVSTLSTLKRWYRPVQDERVGNIGVSLLVR